MMLADYINERYDLADFAPATLDEVIERVLDTWERSDVQVIENHYGFISYQLQGDAIVIYDLYVKPALRNKSNAWKLFNKAIAEAQSQNKRVAITFSEPGKNEHFGLGAIKQAGFIPAYKTDSDTVFIKGL